MTHKWYESSMVLNILYFTSKKYMQVKPYLQMGESRLKFGQKADFSRRLWGIVSFAVNSNGTFSHPMLFTGNRPRLGRIWSSMSSVWSSVGRTNTLTPERSLRLNFKHNVSVRRFALIFWVVYNLDGPTMSELFLTLHFLSIDINLFHLLSICH